MCSGVTYNKAIKTINSACRPRETGLKVEFYAVAIGGGQFERFNKHRTRWTLQKTCCEWAMTVNIRGAARVGACTATLFLIPLLAVLSLCSHVEREVSWSLDQGVKRDLNSPVTCNTWQRCAKHVTTLASGCPLSLTSPASKKPTGQAFFQCVPVCCVSQDLIFPLLRNLAFVWIIVAADASCRVLISLFL